MTQAGDPSREEVIAVQARSGMDCFCELFTQLSHDLPAEGTVLLQIGLAQGVFGDVAKEIGDTRNLLPSLPPAGSHTPCARHLYCP